MHQLSVSDNPVEIGLAVLEFKMSFLYMPKIHRVTYIVFCHLIQ